MPRELRFHVWAGLAYAFVLEALLVAAILFWPKFEDNLPALQAMAPLLQLKDILERIDAGGVSVYVYGQQYFKACNTVGTLAAVILAMGAVAGEAQRGTLEIWLARPVSRRRLLLERWIGGALATTVPVFLTSLTIPWLLGFVEAEMPLGPLMLCAAHESLLLLVFFSATFLWSCLASRPIPIAFGMLMFMVFEFSLYMIEHVTHWSIFRLADVDVFARIGATHALDPRMCLPLAAASAACLVLSLIAFARRVP